jgi:alcohol dehydrogenase class IV
MLPFRYLMPTEIVFGLGCLKELGDRCSPLGKRPLVVTGRRSARESGTLARVLDQLPGAVLLDGIDENPDDKACNKAASLCRKEGCDLVLGLGGGSAIDVAKAAALLAANEGLCVDYYGSARYEHAPLPIVAIPTTAGAGSELTPYSVIVDSAKMRKSTIGGKELFPRLALLDPELTFTLPRSVTASTGLDALSQAMEGMVSRKATPISDTLALDVCRLVKQWLPCAVADGADVEARSHMMYAAALSGCVIAQTGTTLVHGMGYYYTLECGVAHGLANALLLPPLFQFNAFHQPDKVAAIASALGHPCDADPRSVSASIGTALHELLGEVQVSPAAKDAGVQEDRLGDFAREVSSDPYRFRNQVGEVDQERVLSFYRQSWRGGLSA